MSIHNERADRFAGTHVIKVRIHADYSFEVLYIIFLIRRVRVFCFKRSHLIGYTSHGPA